MEIFVIILSILFAVIIILQQIQIRVLSKRIVALLNMIKNTDKMLDGTLDMIFALKDNALYLSTVANAIFDNIEKTKNDHEEK